MLPNLLLNLFLMVVFLALTDEVTFFNALIGFAIGFGITELYLRSAGRLSYAGAVWRLVCFGAYFLRILIKANLGVAWEIVTPGLHMSPRIIRYDVAGLTPVQVTTLANAITLTPGTLTADVDERGETLYIHCMYAGDRDAAVADLDDLRRRLMEGVFNR